MNQFTITLDLYNGDELQKRFDVVTKDVRDVVTAEFIYDAIVKALTVLRDA